MLSDIPVGKDSGTWVEVSHSPLYVRELQVFTIKGEDTPLVHVNGIGLEGFQVASVMGLDPDAARAVAHALVEGADAVEEVET